MKLLSPNENQTQKFLLSIEILQPYAVTYTKVCSRSIHVLYSRLFNKFTSNLCFFAGLWNTFDESSERLSHPTRRSQFLNVR